MGHKLLIPQHKLLIPQGPRHTKDLLLDSFLVQSRVSIHDPVVDFICEIEQPKIYQLTHFPGSMLFINPVC